MYMNLKQVNTSREKVFHNGRQRKHISSSTQEFHLPNCGSKSSAPCLPRNIHTGDRESHELPHKLQEALLPYFALGFAPTFTPSHHKGGSLRCAFIALVRSYNAADTALGKANFRPTSVKELLTRSGAKGANVSSEIVACSVA